MPSWVVVGPGDDAAVLTPVRGALEGIGELVREMRQSGRLRATTDLDDANRIYQDTVFVLVANATPSFEAGAGANLAEGEALTRSFAFTDPGIGDSWTATIDYGDGTAAVTQTFSAPGSIALSHIYADNGAYQVRIVLADDDGGVEMKARQIGTQPFETDPSQSAQPALHAPITHSGGNGGRSSQPAAACGGSGQALPQPPQLLMSFCVSMQVAPPQSAVPCEHESPHRPWVQAEPDGQAVPQLPQLSRSA